LNDLNEVIIIFDQETSISINNGGKPATTLNQASTNQEGQATGRDLK
jgi:hypothetical protein